MSVQTLTRAMEEFKYKGDDSNEQNFLEVSLNTANRTVGFLSDAAAGFNSLLMRMSRTQAADDPAAAMPDLSLADTLVARGEIKSALLIAETASGRLKAQPRPLAVGQAEDAQFMSNVLLEEGKIVLAVEFAGSLGEVCRRRPDVAASYGNILAHLQGKLALAQRDFSKALLSFESSLTHAATNNLPPFLRAPIHLDFARALLQNGDPPLARHQAQLGLSMITQTQGLAEHLQVPYREALAEIALAEKRYGDALSELEQAYLVFDPVEVLDNRLASLHFLEAKIWRALEPTSAGRKFARSLAMQARREYEDWDGGAWPHLQAVNAWLREK